VFAFLPIRFADYRTNSSVTELKDSAPLTELIVGHDSRLVLSSVRSVNLRHILILSSSLGLDFPSRHLPIKIL
jgi:hypothetical protein